MKHLHGLNIILLLTYVALVMIDMPMNAKMITLAKYLIVPLDITIFIENVLCGNFRRIFTASLLFILFMLYRTYSAINYSLKIESIDNNWYLLSMMFLTVMLMHYKMKENELNLIVKVLVFFGVISSICVFSLGQEYTNVEGRYYLGDKSDPNYYAFVLLTPILMSLFKWINTKRTIWLLMSMVIGISMFMLGSRGALLGVMVTIAVYFFKKYEIKYNIILWGILSAIVVLASNWSDRLSVSEATESGGAGRIFIWAAAWNLFLNNMWTGVGVGNFGEYMFSFADSEYAEFTAAHNMYLDLITELGLFGGVLFILMLIFMIKRRTYTANQMYLKMCLLAIMIAGFFLSAFSQKIIWLTCGLMFMEVKDIKREKLNAVATENNDNNGNV